MQADCDIAVGKDAPGNGSDRFRRGRFLDFIPESGTGGIIRGSVMPDLKSKILLFSVRLLSTMGIAIVLPVLPDMATSFSLSITATGFALVSFTLAEASMTPVAGILSDRYGRKAVLLPALLVFALGGLLGLFAETWEELILYRVLQGLGAGPLGVLYTILAADMYDEEHLPRIMGKLTAVASLGSIVFPAVGGFVGEWSWRMPFWGLVLALPVAVLALFVPLRRPTGKQSWSAYLREAGSVIVHEKTMGFFLLIFLSYCIIYGPLNTCFPLLAKAKFAVSSSTIGMVITAIALGSWIGATALPLLHRRWSWSFRALMLWGATGYVLSLCAIPLMPELWLCALPLFVNGMAQGLTLPIINDSVALLAPSQDRAPILAASETFVRCSQSLSPIIFTLGWVTWGMEGPYAMGVVAALAIGLTVIGLFRIPGTVSK